MPPTRYKVVEQGRRLVVIDTWNGDAPATRQAVRPDARAPLLQRTRPAQQQGPGRGGDASAITTAAWFDAKGPRRVKLDGSAQGMLLVAAGVAAMAAFLVYLMWSWPVLLVFGFLLAQKQIRAGLRTVATAWLDMQQPG